MDTARPSVGSSGGNLGGNQSKGPSNQGSHARQFANNGRPAPSPAAGPSRGVQQPKPQALPHRQGTSNIIVNTRQKQNPILKEIKTQAWEFGDIAPDYVLGVTTCALFLSLKYHRLHPEYVYTRIRALQGHYNLRILLTMVDITNHEESLRELSKTSLINNVTIILCWSSQEAGRYLELYKTYENAPATAIKAPQSTNHGDKLIEFITTPRSINKTDALGLVSNFGSVRTAVNAKPEEILMIAGWGQTKVQRWHSAVSEPFRSRKAAKRGIAQDLLPTQQVAKDDESVMVVARAGSPISAANHEAVSGQRPPKRAAEDFVAYEPDEDEEEALFEATREPTAKTPTAVNPASTTTPKEPEVTDGVMAALARLREQG